MQLMMGAYEGQVGTHVYTYTHCLIIFINSHTTAHIHLQLTARVEIHKIGEVVSDVFNYHGHPA